MNLVLRFCSVKPAMLALLLMFAHVVSAENQPATPSGHDEENPVMQAQDHEQTQGQANYQASVQTSDQADADNVEPVYKRTVSLPQQRVYSAVYDSLEQARFYVVFEPNIGQNLAQLAERWGEDYNKNSLTAIRSMVFCNAWYANRVSNVDPDMLGMCPLHLTLFERQRDGQPATTILFNRPTVIAANSPAYSAFEEVEKEVIAAIEAGVASAQKKQLKNAE